MKFKNRKLIWSFRIWAVYDVLFSNKFATLNNFHIFVKRNKN